MINEKDASLEAQVPLIHSNKTSFESSGHCSSLVDHDSSYEQKALLRKLFAYSMVILPWLLLLIVGFSKLISLKEPQSTGYCNPDLFYSPVQDVIEYEPRIFTTGFPKDPSPYSAEPSPELDELWKGLYPSSYQLIPKEQAMKLENKTVIFPHDPQRRYVIELDLFHQLHCLNDIRKATRPDYYVANTSEQVEGDLGLQGLKNTHITHCIDTIRQAIMCAADTSVYTWEWREDIQLHVNVVKNPHTCRNFDKIREWATVNTIRKYFDGEYRVMNDPLDPSTWVDGYTGE